VYVVFSSCFFVFFSAPNDFHGILKPLLTNTKKILYADLPNFFLLLKKMMTSLTSTNLGRKKRRKVITIPACWLIEY